MKIRKCASFIAVLLSLTLLYGCGGKGTENGGSSATPVPVNLTKYHSDENQTVSWDNETACAITLNGTDVTIGGNGASGKGSDVTISQPGTYVVSGTASDLRLVVDCAASGTVRIVLNNASVTSGTSCPLYIKNCEKTIVTLADGSSNTLTDAASYTYDDTEKEEPSACVFSKDDLYFNGTGTLTVNANFNDGIQSKDDLVILGGNINVTSADDGLIGKDLVLIGGGTVTLVTEGDGIKSTNDESDEVGIVAVEDGTLNITAGGGSKNSSAGSDGWGKWGSASADDTGSAKGIKAASALVFTGGTVTVDSSDDALHSNGSVEISGGTFTLASGDDGVHADEALLISDCKMEITKSYEGLEGANITVTGGSISVTASDDGLNAAGGADASSLGGRPGQNSFGASSAYYIKIEGGEITVNAGGDGIDSNGSISMTGGALYISGPTDNGNGAIDYESSFEISGGILVAAGSSGMAQAPSAGTQYSVSATFSQAQAGNTEVTLTDSDGNILVSFTPAKQFQNVVISCPALEKGKTYSVSAGENSAGSCTVTDTVSYIGSSGNAFGGGPQGQGPGGGPGGGPQGQGGFGRR